MRIKVYFRCKIIILHLNFIFIIVGDKSVCIYTMFMYI